VLDLVITRDPDIVHDIQPVENVAGSDYNTIILNVDFERIIESYGQLFDFNNGNYDSIWQELKNVKWESCLTGDTENRRQQWLMAYSKSLSQQRL
jgi:hypothetical protein